MKLGGRTRLLGVMGHPIEHSLSPRMHNASFEALDWDYAYVALNVLPKDLEEAVAGAKALGFRGFNVTMPHKEAILPVLDEIDDIARLVGAANTVTIESGRTRGTNTDGAGFVEACAEAGISFEGSRVLVLGAGGAAAAIGAAVLGEGVREVRIVNRTVERARALAERLRSASARTSASEAEVGAWNWEKLSEALAGVDVFVNATYIGMRAGDTAPIPEEYLSQDIAVCDAVYRAGGETRLVRAARERGATVVGGERMLLYQGVQAQRIWTGGEPAVGVMSGALS